MPDEVRRVAAVVLAAGASSRLGRAKQLLEFRGVSLVHRAASEALRAGARPVIVVLGARSTEVGAALAGLPAVHTVVNHGWENGLASSLVAGVREVIRMEPACDGVLVTTVDQPLVEPVSLRTLLDAFDSDARLVAAGYAGTIGVPAVIGRQHFASLLKLTGDAGAGPWLRARIAEVTRVPMPEATLDIDDADDLATLGALAQPGAELSEPA